ncbi:MAG TPA: HD domain-containing protein, partial [Bacilli bacterium]|nr:HD domain-containing protein [Bacilli bacterium]
MERVEQAKAYAIKAHGNQLRKSNGKPMIYHPLAVGELLKDYGYSESVIAAGYLHDTVEDTPTTMEDIKLLFGAEIAKLVANASEPNKELSWEERKQHTIDLVKVSSLDEIVVVIADKIHNLEDLTKELQIQGLSLFNSFKRGVDQQNWYYTAIYEAINNEDQERPIVKRLASALANFKNEIAYQTELETVIFNDDLELLYKLRELHKLKYRVRSEGYIKPFIIEILGTPRTGKTTIINNILDFLKKGGFKVTYFKELVTSEFYHEINRLPLYERNMAIIDEIVKQLKSVTEQQKIVAKHNEVKDINLRVFDNDGDIIIFDRGIFDRYIWFRRLLDLK